MADTPAKPASTMIDGDAFLQLLKKLQANGIDLHLGDKPDASAASSPAVPGSVTPSMTVPADVTAPKPADAKPQDKFKPNVIQDQPTQQLTDKILNMGQIMPVVKPQLDAINAGIPTMDSVKNKIGNAVATMHSIANIAKLFA
jgi:hypothetical protein